ncbi:siderophore esterase IroE [Mariannaea sp. PMI_226]|nr:siderophore esterase IroE [Mariannaea sp. PMI_226]
MTQLDEPALEVGSFPNSCQYTAKTSRGDYVVQIAWPYCWNKDRIPPEEDERPVSILYLVDGNAYFATAVDVSRRLEFTDSTRTIVVGIGYPKTKYIYDWRRGPDLTPPTRDGKFDDLLGSDGKPRDDVTFGEADQFLSFIQNDVMTFVENDLFKHLPLGADRKALFGHSYGGLFVLNALFTKPTLFDTFIAASPSISWNRRSVVSYQEADFRARKTPVNPPRGLLMTWGSLEQDYQRQPSDTDEDYERKKKEAAEERMRDNGLEMAERLRSCPSIRHVRHWEFKDEDHGSAAVTGLQRGLMQFLINKM